MTAGGDPGAGWHRADGAPAQRRERHRRRRRGAGEALMVEEAEFTSYYGRPVIKPPVWKQPDVPLYLFLGGTAGSSAVLGCFAEMTGRSAMARAAHLTAAGTALSSVGFLIHDLGRPSRFLNMLRVFKTTSPLSVGSWILAPFGALTTVTAGAHLLGRFPLVRAVSSAGAAALGGPMMTYTAALLANTAVPAWHAAHRELPFVFAGSALAAGGGIATALSPVTEAGPARRTAIAGAVLDLATMHRIEHEHGIVSEPYRDGKAGKLLRAARACTATGAGLALAAGRRRVLGVASGTLLAAGAVLTRFGVYEAGMASARDPRYTVEPQRARAAAAAAEEAASESRT
ncbi:NrfD/PsrC family molybdoenzyme membrane anchor subunit [Blastococcus saxobsidens]|uniref:Formate-dependent nitrite reductase, membrane component n=1 Tax=Blastococcus saxobsidens (strain DD2) TaxID=1146883 RepID=H6RNG2_BLASD|nr:NrfD/PsrC family molybdoenzyme membrane anchor subunit [Blastococcus saxobsidens]CCG03909.1 Formate-dependent nitrite reductase, membrane component [Blastococcus saxobsidens DD2]